MKVIPLTFKDCSNGNPCLNCTAPCCRVIMIPHKTPATFMDLDFIRYLLNFPRIEVAVSKSGEWLILIREVCRQFDQDSHSCKVHATNEQPFTCQYYNPYQCWYKPNLAFTSPRDICILKRETFEYWTQWVRLNEISEVISAPDFEESRKLLQEWDRQQLAIATEG